MLGGSYIHGSAYCQGYPVVHFNPCSDNVPAWSAYGTLNLGRLKVLGEFAQTTKVWPGTQCARSRQPALAICSVQGDVAHRRWPLQSVRGRTSRPTSALNIAAFRPGRMARPGTARIRSLAGFRTAWRRASICSAKPSTPMASRRSTSCSGGNQPAGATWSDAERAQQCADAGGSGRVLSNAYFVIVSRAKQ
jgi:hypothetical protein